MLSLLVIKLGMKTNLNVSKYKDGTPIPEVTDPVEWAKLTTRVWYYYDYDSSNGKLYGKLYNWYAVNNNKGLTPAGYQIPAGEQWTTLTNFIGSEAGLKMKETDTSNWTSPNSEATNSTGFTGLLGGICISNGDIILLVIMATGGVQPVWTQQRPGIEV
jgi:uncharacterized protein (TIGR02145 family)